MSESAEFFCRGCRTLFGGHRIGEAMHQHLLEAGGRQHHDKMHAIITEAIHSAPPAIGHVVAQAVHHMAGHEHPAAGTALATKAGVVALAKQAVARVRKGRGMKPTHVMAGEVAASVVSGLRGGGTKE